MLAGDFGEFETLMRQFEKIFGKKIDDDTMNTYFGALREVPLSVVRRKAEDYLKRAKFFPKPADLRPKMEEPKEQPKSDGKFEAAEERSMWSLEELRRTNPEAWIAQMERTKPGYLALQYARDYGVANIWYDIPNRCWRRVQS